MDRIREKQFRGTKVIQVIDNIESCIDAIEKLIEYEKNETYREQLEIRADTYNHAIEIIMRVFTHDEKESRESRREKRMRKIHY